MRRHAILAVSIAAVCLPAAAQLKPGLWEITNKVGGNAQLDAARAQMQQQLAAMPPEQRKQMEAMMAQRGMSMPGAAAGGEAHDLAQRPRGALCDVLLRSFTDSAGAGKTDGGVDVGGVPYAGVA